MCSADYFTAPMLVGPCSLIKKKKKDATKPVHLDSATVQRISMLQIPQTFFR